MPPLLIAQLIVAVGLPLADQIIKWCQAGTTVTPQMWDDLKKKIQTPFEELAGPK